MGMSKGGQQQQQTQIPPSLERAAIQNLSMADEIGRIGFAPQRGPTVAGLSPTQRAAFDNTNRAASAMGLAGGPDDPTAHMLGDSFGDGAAFGTGSLYDQELDRMAPGQRQAIESYMINPRTGAPALNRAPNVDGLMSSRGRRGKK